MFYNFIDGFLCILQLFHCLQRPDSLLTIVTTCEAKYLKKFKCSQGELILKMEKIIELPVIACESIESLADKLNQELRNQRAIKFHNNGGIFTRNLQGGQIVSKLTIDFPESPQYNEVYYTLDCSFEQEREFFKVTRLGDVVGEHFRYFGDLTPHQKGLIYGPRDLPIGEYPTDGNSFFSQLDSPTTGPVVGDLIPTKFRSFFRFQKQRRLCYKRG